MALEFVQVKEEPLWEGETPPSVASMVAVHMVNQELAVELEPVQDSDFNKTLEMDSRTRTSVDQFTALLEFMEEHGDLARAVPGVGGRMRSDQLWQELGARLSQLGGGVRGPNKWKKVWADWKTKTKKKASVISARAAGPPSPPGAPGPQSTRLGAPSRHVLSALERRLLAVMGAAGLPSRPPAPPALTTHLLLELPPAAAAPERPAPPSAPRLPPLAPRLPLPPLPLPREPPPAPPPARVSEADAEAPPPGTPARAPLPSRAGFTRHPRTHTHAHARTHAHAHARARVRRLRLAEERERNTHERETERLRLEAERIAADCERNVQLKRLADVAEKFMEKFGGLVEGSCVNSEHGVS